MNPFSSEWPRSIAVIDYLVEHLDLAAGLAEAAARHADTVKQRDGDAVMRASTKMEQIRDRARGEAGLILQERCLDGSVRTRGPRLSGEAPRAF